MGATHMHLAEMRWSPQFETTPVPRMVGLADSDGNTWRFNNAISWHDFKRPLRRKGSNNYGKRPANTEVDRAWRKGST